MFSRLNSNYVITQTDRDYASLLYMKPAWTFLVCMSTCRVYVRTDITTAQRAWLSREATGKRKLRTASGTGKSRRVPRTSQFKSTEWERLS